jgi:sugar phosphate isomerase/epimerase
MRFGCCPGLASFVPPTLEGQEESLSVAHAQQCERVPRILELLADAGYDYVELGVGITAPEQPESFFERLLGVLDDAPLKAEAFSSFVPPWIKVVGPEADWHRIEEYVRVAVDRVSGAGGERIVFGSGGARSCPEGYPLSQARADLLRFAHLAGDYCQAHGIVLCLEPLNSTETNMLTQVSEAAALAREVGRPCVQVLADCFHMNMEQEPYANIVAAGDLLQHIHVADRGRRYPADFGYDIDGFFAALRQAGYDGRVSIEANFADLATEAPAGLARLRRAAA